MKIRTLLLICSIGVFGGVFETYAASSPVTDDLWDVSQGIDIIAHTSTHSTSDIRNMFGYSHNDVFPHHADNMMFQDRLPQGIVHSVEWATQSPVELSRFVLYAQHSDNVVGANHRGFSEFRFYAQGADGRFVLQDSITPNNPYGGGTAENDLTYEATFDTPITSQRFKAEFVQYGPPSLSSGPLIIELDGFGTALPDLSSPVYDDLFDVSNGITVTNDSGVLTRQGGADIRDMFGGELGGLFPLLDELGNMIFEDELPAGTTHFVEWQTAQPITLERIHLFAAHGDVDHRGNTVDANARGFTRFALFAKSESGAFEKIYEYFPENPYGGGGPPAFHELAIAGDIDAAHAQEFRAEFDQWGPPSTHSAPRIIELDGFGTSEPAEPERHPIVVVPGMVVSVSPLTTFLDKPSSFWMFTLGARGIYSSLIQQLALSGFFENEMVFTAHYDWRQPVSDNVADYLKPVIEEAKQKTGSDKVDIVAHSMGGLLARDYIQSDAYDNDVDQLITLGTPHLGAADAYVAWEGGDFPTTWSSGIKFYIRSIARSLNATQDTNLEPPISYRTFFPSLKDLLPVTNFVTRDSSDVPVAALTEQNDFLQNLQADITQIEERGVDATAVVGTDVSTLGNIALVDNRTTLDEVLSRWRDGRPAIEPIEPNTPAGDQRVLAQSAGIGSSIITLTGANHDELPHIARRQVLEILGIEPEVFEYEPPDITSLFGITVLSPVDPTITCGNETLSKDQNTFGEDVAQYIADPDHPDAPKILAIGNPPEVECEVTLTGTGEGEYTIITIYADEDEVISTSHDGETKAGKTETYNVNITSDSFTPPAEDVVSLLCQIPDTVKDLMFGRHLKPRAHKLHGITTRMCSFANNWEKEINKQKPRQRSADRWENRTRSDYARFVKELNAQIKQENLDNTAIKELLSLQTKLEDAGWR